MFVEVKGPGDSLSDKQRMWGHDLRKNGLHMHVCYVRCMEPVAAGVNAHSFD